MHPTQSHRFLSHLSNALISIRLVVISAVFLVEATICLLLFGIVLKNPCLLLYHPYEYWMSHLSVRALMTFKTDGNRSTDLSDISCLDPLWFTSLIIHSMTNFRWDLVETIWEWRGGILVWVIYALGYTIYLCYIILLFRSSLRALFRKHMWPYFTFIYV